MSEVNHSNFSAVAPDDSAQADLSSLIEETLAMDEAARQRGLTPLSEEDSQLLQNMFDEATQVPTETGMAAAGNNSEAELKVLDQELANLLSDAPVIAPSSSDQNNDWQILAQEREQAIVQMQQQVEQLQGDLSVAQRQIQAQMGRSRSAEVLIDQQAHDLNSVQENYHHLYEKLESAHQSAKSQQLLIETLSEQLELNQEKIEQLEKDRHLWQEKYQQQHLAWSEQQVQLQELQVRLNRQQNYTLQYKLALEQYATGTTTTDDSPEKPTQPSPIAMTVSAIPPWSAPEVIAAVEPVSNAEASPITVSSSQPLESLPDEESPATVAVEATEPASTAATTRVVPLQQKTIAATLAQTESVIAAERSQHQESDSQHQESEQQNRPVAAHDLVSSLPAPAPATVVTQDLTPAKAEIPKPQPIPLGKPSWTVTGAISQSTRKKATQKYPPEGKSVVRSPIDLPGFLHR